MNRYRHDGRPGRITHERLSRLFALCCIAAILLGHIGRALADEPCGEYFHAAWIVGTVTWHQNPTTGEIWATISPAQERCEWFDACEGTTEPDQTHERGYTLIDKWYAADGPDGRWQIHYSWRADSGCQGLPTFKAASSTLPKKWSVETGISGGALSGSATRTASVGSEVSVSVTEAADDDSYTIQGVPGKTIVPDGVSYKWTATGGSISNSTSRSATWTAPDTPGSYTLSCKVDDAWLDGQTPPVTGVSGGDLGNRNDTGFTRTITVTVIAYPNLTVRRTGTTNYSSNAKVASGVVGDSSLADLLVQYPTAEAGQACPPLKIKSGGRGKTNAPTDITATISMAASVTDAEGKIHGTFRSGNRIEPTVVYADMNGNNTHDTGEPSVTIYQVWNALAGSSAAWTYDGFFVEGIPSPITYKMLFNDNQEVSITEHPIGFATTKLKGIEWDYDAGLDWDHDGEPDGAYVANREYDLKPNSGDSTDLAAKKILLKSLVEYGDTAETPVGSYNSTQTVHDYLNEDGDIDFYVETVYFDAVDEGVYKDPPTP